MILHLVTQAEWNAKAVDQPYLPDAFAKDGFIHCTQGDEMMLQIANRFYKGAPGEFLALGIDESKVKAQIKWEAPSSPGAPALPEAQTAAPEAFAAKTVETPPEVEAEFGATAIPLFPHVYGPLNRDAIVEIRRVARGADGAFTGFAPVEATAPAGMRLKTPSQLANELVDVTGDFSAALARYKDRIEARMDELDKNIKDRLS